MGFSNEKYRVNVKVVTVFHVLILRKVRLKIKVNSKYKAFMTSVLQAFS